MSKSQSVELTSVKVAYQIRSKTQAILFNKAFEDCDDEFLEFIKVPTVFRIAYETFKLLKKRLIVEFKTYKAMQLFVYYSMYYNKFNKRNISGLIPEYFKFFTLPDNNPAVVKQFEDEKSERCMLIRLHGANKYVDKPYTVISSVENTFCYTEQHSDEMVDVHEKAIFPIHIYDILDTHSDKLLINASEGYVHFDVDWKQCFQNPVQYFGSDPDMLRCLFPETRVDPKVPRLPSPLESEGATDDELWQLRLFELEYFIRRKKPEKIKELGRSRNVFCTKIGKSLFEAYADAARETVLTLEDPNMVQLLLESPFGSYLYTSDLDFDRNKRRKQAIHVYCEHFEKYKPALLKLLRYEKLIYAFDEQLRSPFHIAAETKNVTLFKLLLDRYKDGVIKYCASVDTEVNIETNVREIKALL